MLWDADFGLIFREFIFWGFISIITYHKAQIGVTLLEKLNTKSIICLSIIFGVFDENEMITITETVRLLKNNIKISIQ